MEWTMLEALDYDLGYPITVQFLRYIVKLFSCSRQAYYQAKFVSEFLLVSYKALKWSPSEIAITALDIKNTPSVLVPILQQAGFEVDDISVQQCKQFTRKLLRDRDLNQFTTVFKKYEKIYDELMKSLI